MRREALYDAFQNTDREFERYLIRLQQAAVAGRVMRHDSEGSSEVATPTLTPRLSPILGAAPASSGGTSFTVSGAPETAAGFIPGAGFNGVGAGALGDFDNPEAIDDQSGCTAVVAVIMGNSHGGM